MKPLNVGLLLREGDRFALRQELRWCGFFSYAVPEFTVDQIVVEPRSVVDCSALTDYDVLVCEDETVCSFEGEGPPIVSLTWDGTLSREHLHRRRRQAAMCDLILVEHDALDRYQGLGKPVRRLLFAVNDHVYKDYELEKTIDISFNCRYKHRPDRANLDLFLREFAPAAGLVYSAGYIDDPIEYAQALARSKIVVNLSKTPYCRNFRFFEVMASRSCLLSSPMPGVSGDHMALGSHYHEYNNFAQLAGKITSLLTDDRWQLKADRGFALIQERYTWSIRAQELRVILQQELGL